MRNSIRTRLTIAFVGLAISPLLLVGIVLAWQSFTTQEQQALNLQREVARRVSTQVTAFFEGLENELRLTSQVQGLQKLDRDKQRSVLSELLSYHDVFEELALLDSKGQEQVHLSRSSFAPGLRDRSTTDEFIAPQTSGQTYYSPVRFEEATGEPLMTLAVPLLDARTGQAAGVLVSEVRIKKIWDLIADVQVSSGQSVYIVNAQGQVVAHRNPSVVLGGTSFRVPDQAGIQPGLGGSSVVLAVDKVSVGEQAFNVVAEQTVSEALALAFNTVLITGGLIVVALVVSGSLGFVTVRQIVQPIQTMATAAQAISAGDLSQQVRITRQDELGVLANAFNSMTTQLQSLIGGLEQRVAERTTEISQANKRLSRQTNQLQTSAQVSRAATTLVDPDQLMPRVVELIQQQFGFYYVGLFLVDPDNRYVVLEAGTGEAGRIMKERGHRLEIGGQSMVGWAGANRKARIALDVGREPVRFANPLLPETHSEMALPLLAGERVLGALDVQSTEVAAFDESDIAALQGMADQIAVALENARLFRQTQAAVQELEKANRTMVREGWEGYLERQGGTRRAEFAPPSAPAAEALAQALSIPLELRGQPIGRLTLRREGDHPWSDEEVDMLRAIALQTVLAADNARLFEEAQRLAERERLINEITARIRGSLTLEGILSSAIRELSHITGARYGKIKLEMAETN